MNETELSEKIKEIVTNFWNDKNTTLLLSNIPSLLSEVDDKYREVMSGKSLKQFIEDSHISEDIKIARHPTQKAKIGLVPSSAYHDRLYEIEPKNSPAIKKKQKPNINDKKPALIILDLLSNLSDEDLKKVDIPVSILMKLYK